MSSVDINRLKGNYAENLVATWLSRICLVRPVAVGTDIGIDLYCESIIEGTPFLHFWVQVKAIGRNQIRKENENTIAWYDFDTNHLRYWQRQPIPVYAFLVPVDDWPPKEAQRIYTVRITEQLVRYGIPNQKQWRLKTSDYASLDSIDDDLNKFVAEIVPWDSSALLLQKGIVAPIPISQEFEEKAFPKSIGYQYLGNIADAICDAATLGLINSVSYEEKFFSVRHLRKRFEAVMQIYEDDLSPWGISALFHSARIDNRPDIAHQYILRAIKKVEADPKRLPDDKAASIAELNQLLKDLDS